jgi:hypothetical protein
LVVAGSFLALPYVITTSNPLVDNVQAATALQAFQAAQPYVPTATSTNLPKAPQSVIAQLEQSGGPPELALAAILTGTNKGEGLFTALGHLPAALKPQAASLLTFNPLASDIQQGRKVTAAQIATVARSSPQLAGYLVAEKVVVPAQKAAPKEWKRWWWVCVGGQVVFLVIIFFIRGNWRPAVAKREAEERERFVEEEIEKLRLEQPEGVLAGL